MQAARLYYEEAYTAQFDATVIESAEFNGHPAVVLDASYFYPESGGQPHDCGTIGAATVINVQIRAEDQAVLHVLDQPLPLGTYPAAIDWQRRFDLMQQHTGQHILSQAFVQLAEANTIGFHVGAESCTIDLNVAKLDADVVTRVEVLANQIVWENRPISTYFIPLADAHKYPLRKVPEGKGDTLRIVEIADFDYNACGGTHVSAAGAVGLIKVTKLEKIRKQMRVEFRCGQRAFIHYAQSNGIVTHLASDFTCAVGDLPTVIAKLRDEAKQARKTLKKQQATLLNLEAQQLLTAAKTGSLRIVKQVFEQRDFGELRQLAQTITRQSDTVALVGNGDGIILARAKNLGSIDMKSLLQPIIDSRAGRGGGSPQFSQAMQLGMNSAEQQDILDDIAARIQQSAAS